MNIKQFLKSKRFFFTCISVVLFCVCVFVFKLAPMESAGAVTALLAPYLIVETIKRSN